MYHSTSTPAVLKLLVFLQLVASGTQAAVDCRRWHRTLDQLLTANDSSTVERFRGVEEQFDQASAIAFCTSDDEQGTEHQFFDDLQHILEYASAISLKPGPLMAMTRRVSTLSQGCHTGIRYMEPASQHIALERFSCPRSAMFRAPETKVKGYFDLAQLADTVYSDTSSVQWNSLSDLAGEMAGGDARMTLPSAQRFLTGGDRFPQSFAKAEELLERAILELSSGEAITLLSQMHWFGLGHLQSDRQTSLRLAFLAAKQLRVSSAIPIVAKGLVEFSGTLSGLYAVDDYLEEARMLYTGAGEKGEANAVVSLVAMDLIYDRPVRMKWLMLLSAAIVKGDAVAVNLLGKIASNKMLGMHTCSHAWNLLARAVRRDLWTQASMNAAAQHQSLSDLQLARLALAGVEQAEWALANKHTPLTHRHKLKLLAFAAHRGRPAAQFRLSQHTPQRSVKSTSSRRIQASVSTEEEVEIDQILQEWHVDSEAQSRVPTLLENELAHAHRELLVNQRNRWLTFEEEVNGYAIVAAETLTNMAWDSFLGHGTEQNLRDAIIHISRLPRYLGHLWPMEKLYYILLQAAFSLNFIVLHMSTRMMCAAILAFVSLFGLILNTRLKPSH